MWWAGSAWKAFKLELLPMARLAGPVVLAELGWMSMGVVDTMMVGRVSPAAIGSSVMPANPLGLTVAATLPLLLVQVQSKSRNNKPNDGGMLHEISAASLDAREFIAISAVA